MTKVRGQCLIFLRPVLLFLSHTQLLSDDRRQLTDRTMQTMDEPVSYRMFRGMLLSLLWSVSPTALAETTDIVFKASSAELDAKQNEKLSKLAEATKSIHSTTFFIEEHTAKSKPRSLVFNIERVRGLKIFQTLVQNGVDPARIVFRAPQPAPKGDTLRIISKIDESIAATAILQPAPSGSPAGAQEFRFYFPLGRADFEGLKDADFKNVLNSLGQPGKDVILIQGFTDSSGSARNNEVLSEFRALRVYEHLVRNGVSPIRIKTAGMGVAKGALDAQGRNAEQQALSRQTLVSWINDEEVRKITTLPSPTPTEVLPKESVNYFV